MYLHPNARPGLGKECAHEWGDPVPVPECPTGTHALQRCDRCEDHRLIRVGRLVAWSSAHGRATLIPSRSADRCERDLANLMAGDQPGWRESPIRCTASF